MSELKVYIHHIKKSMLGNTIVGQSYCLKSEADKVIAELKDDVTYWKKVAKKNMDDNVVMAKQRADAFKRERHQKYKRCLAMAKWCASRSAAWMADPADDILHKSDFYDRWKLRWRELAEKFKEAK